MYANRRWYDLTGAESADWRTAVHPDDLRDAVRRLRETLASGEVFEAEFRLRSADGTYRWHLARAVPVHDEHGTIDHWVGTATDVDDQKRSAEMQRFLLDASTLLGSTIATRATFAELAELAVPHLGSWCAIELDADDGRRVVVGIAHDVPRKVSLVRELRTRYPDALAESEAVDELHRELLRDLDVRSSISVPMTARGRTVGTMTFARSSEERAYGEVELELARDLAQRAAIALDNGLLFREAEERAEAARVLAAIGDGVALVDDDGIVRLWNPAAERITGVPVADAVGRALAEAVPALAPLANEDGGWTGPFELTGGERWLAFSVEHFDGGTVYAFRDQTDERALEAMRQDLVATVSHEVRTPLAAIYGAALTLRRDDVELEEVVRERLLDIVVEESARLGEIVNDLLTANQIDAGILTATIEPCDPAELAESVVAAARTHLPSEITLELRSPDALPQVAADPGQLHQVLANLVDNAVKYSPEGGGVDVELESRGDYVRFVVRDPGLGIPAAEQRRIFEKFYRLDPDMTQGIGGTGLGLYICRELVRRVGGRIWVESREGEGSTFYVEVPVARDGGDAGLRRSPSPATAAA